jgi:hypothetical protein
VAEPFHSRTPFDPTYPPALAVYCSDGRFTQAVEELLHELGHPRLDTMTMPGGPALLNRLSATYAEGDAVGRATSFLIRSHGIKEVALLAHAGCGYYKARRPSDTPEQHHARQLDDLRAAARTLLKVEPTLHVRLFYAQPTDGRVRFEPVPMK